MKKILISFVMILTLLQFGIVHAAVGNLNCIVTKPDDFKDSIIVKITSVSTPGYDEKVEKELDITSDFFYLNGIVAGIPAGTYSVETYMYKNGDPEKKPYNNPNFKLSAPTSFQLLEGQNYEYKITIEGVPTPVPLPTTEGDVGTTEEEPKTEITPEPAPSPVRQPNPIVDLFVDIFKNSWLTVILFLIVGGAYLFIRIRKAIYKE